MNSNRYKVLATGKASSITIKHVNTSKTLTTLPDQQDEYGTASTTSTTSATMTNSAIVADSATGTNTNFDMTVETPQYNAQVATRSSNVAAQPEVQTDEYAPQIIPDRYTHGKTSRPLRILIVATEAPPVRGGIARVVGYLRDGFQGYGHHVDVLAYPNVGRVSFGEVRLSSLSFKLPQLFRRFKEYDVIHVHGATPTISDVMLLFTRMYSSRPVIVYTHHMDLDFGPVKLLNKVYNYMHRQFSAQADAVIAGTLDNLPVQNRRSSVIPFGIDLKHFRTRKAKDDQFTVLFTGQFRPYKGIRILLQAMAQVSGVRLLIAGHGPEEQIYRDLAAELKLDVEFHIGVNDDQLRKLYQRAHVIMLPSVSRLEAFGLTLIEGMAAGCIPIASNLPGVRDVVGKTGLTFPVGDVDRLAEILRDLRDDRAQVQRMSANAYVRASEFDQENTVYEYERLMTGLVTCRKLKDQLADKMQSSTLALDTFVTNIVQDLEADEMAIVLRTANDKLYPVASTHIGLATERPELQQVIDLLASHAINTGKSTLIGPNNDGLRLQGEVSREMSGAMVTPLTRNGEHIGALLLMRNRAFTQNDLDNLVRFAHYIAPSLHAAGQKASKTLRIVQQRASIQELAQAKAC